jgi:hypothetical protein
VPTSQDYGAAMKRKLLPWQILKEIIVSWGWPRSQIKKVWRDDKGVEIRTPNATRDSIIGDPTIIGWVYLYESIITMVFGWAGGKGFDIATQLDEAEEHFKREAACQLRLLKEAQKYRPSRGHGVAL